MTDSHASRARRVFLPCALLVLIGVGFADRDVGGGPPTTAREFVATYESLADAILAVKKTETNLVMSVLTTAYAHAATQAEHVRKAMKANDEKAAHAALENVATHVAHLGTEGDNSVARVRKRLLEGGHHHNAEGEAKGIFDEGFVVVTKAAKKRFLDASVAIAKLKATDADAFEREWKNVDSAWTDLTKNTK